MSDSDDEIEETFLVYADFNGMLDSEILKNPDTNFKLIGVDSEKPVLQIRDQVYIGEYKEALGTNLFFKEVDHTPMYEDPVFSKNNQKGIEYVCKSRKLLNFTRSFLKKPEDENKTNEIKDEEIKIKNENDSEKSSDLIKDENDSEKSSDTKKA